MKKELDSLLHPLYRKIYVTKNRETGQKFVGTLLLMHDDLNDGYGDYQAVKWYVCLININDNTDYYRIKWGTATDSIRLNDKFTKPEPVDDSEEGMEYWFEKWKHIVKTFSDKNPTRQLWKDSNKGGQIGYQQAYQQSPTPHIVDYMTHIKDPSHDDLKGKKESSEKLKQWMREWLDDDSHKKDLADSVTAVTKTISSDFWKI